MGGAYDPYEKYGLKRIINAATSLTLLGGSMPRPDVFKAMEDASKALRRTDIGRLHKGAKPDIVILNLQTTRIAPVYDPIKSMVNAATSDNVERVYCDGRLLVDQGKVLCIDETNLLAEVQEIADNDWKRVSDWDYAERELREYAPLSYDEWESE